MTYIDHKDDGHRTIFSWSDHTYYRLKWLYGDARASRIMAGNDAHTLSDLQAWRELGKARAA